MTTTTMTKAEAWDYLIDNMIATEEELKLVTNINGYNMDTLEAVLYARTGYRSLSQVTGEDNNEEEG